MGDKDYGRGKRGFVQKMDIHSTRLLEETFLREFEHHPTIGSTQDRARELASLPDLPLPMMILAEEQTSGRGRGDNRWWTGEGGLAFSLLFEPSHFDLPARPLPQLSLATAVALIDALADRIAPAPMGLHWPNDIYSGGKKLAGILVDSLSGGRHAAGIGLNVNNRAADAPPELQGSVATLRDLGGRTFDRTDILIDFLRSFEGRLRELSLSSTALGARFNALCLQHGQLLRLRSGPEIAEGICAGIAPDGALLLDTAQGRRVFYSGTLR